MAGQILTPYSLLFRGVTGTFGTHTIIMIPASPPGEGSFAPLIRRSAYQRYSLLCAFGTKEEGSTEERVPLIRYAADTLISLRIKDKDFVNKVYPVPSASYKEFWLCQLKVKNLLFLLVEDSSSSFGNFVEEASSQKVLADFLYL